LKGSQIMESLIIKILYGRLTFAIGNSFPVG